MDWQALGVSLRLAAGTLVILLPLGILVAHRLAVRTFRGKAVVEALLAVPLVLPPTVLGYYLLTAFGVDAPLGRWFASLLGQTLAFSFPGLLAASVIANIPFVIQPMQRSFEAVPRTVREAAATCGLGSVARFFRIDVPLAWPGIVSAAILTFAHTLGIAIYDRVQAFDDHAAAVMAATLLALAVASLAVTVMLTRRRAGHGAEHG